MREGARQSNTFARRCGSDESDNPALCRPAPPSPRVRGAPDTAAMGPGPFCVGSRLVFARMTGGPRLAWPMLPSGCMTHAKLWMACAGIVAIVACADMGTSNESATPAGSLSDGGKNGEAAPSAGLDQPAASGVVLVHGAAFPAFRLCFEKLPSLPPQPDSKVMPEANVVGVEIGSVVRIDPLVAPGKIYVINERVVRTGIGDTSPATCGELISTTSPKRLAENNDFHVITEPINEPLGAGRVQLLAVTGCGNQAFLDFIRAPSSSCGEGWDAVRGNLKARVVDVPAAPRSSESVPVQVFPMSSAIEAFRKGGTLAVSFGKLADAGLTQLEPGPAYVGGPLSQITFDQTDTAVYGSHGFRVEITPPAASAFRVEQTLAGVQQLSAPNDLPTTYYHAASSYALVLLGDPTHQPQLPSGGANPDYSARRAVHFVAVPVIEQTAGDAGADGGDAAAR
jgi:hypothetical protein